METETAKTVDVKAEVMPHNLKQRKIFMILNSKDLEDLENQIAQALIDGYVLHFQTFENKGKFYQAMVHEKLLRTHRELGATNAPRGKS